MKCDFSFLPAVLFQNSFLQTTAHTLCFTFALLALYPDEQERLYQHIKGVMSSLNGAPVSFMIVYSYGELTLRVDLRRYESFYAIIGVSSFYFLAKLSILILGQSFLRDS